MVDPSQVPRPEYPRPQFVRDRWMCLNGPWQFEVDRTDDGLGRGVLARDLARAITVPFCPESTLSGIGETGFMPSVWYRRDVAIPPEWHGMHTLLHFQAVDHDATVWVDGREVARHRGGFTPFTADLGKVAGQTVTVVVRARDDVTAVQPRGKQAIELLSSGCLYTRTTGIWQTVWMEPVPCIALQRPHLRPDVHGSRFLLEQPVTSSPPGWMVRATLSDGPLVHAEATCALTGDFTPSLTLPIPAAMARRWSPADPHLYDVVVDLVDDAGQVVDSARTYGGLRGITRDGHRLLLDGQPIFQRLVLDQGYWPDGVMTAPTDAHLVADIELAMSAGFNGARVHERVAEERFLYHADRLGYLVWGEFPDWYGDITPDRFTPDLPATYVAQWLEAVERDRSHPCIVGWCPLNETHGHIDDGITALDDVTRAMVRATRLADPSRPILDASGHAHRVPESDVWDSHDYEQDSDRFARNHAGLGDGAPFVNAWGGAATSIPYGGQPYFVSEFGGIWWNPASADGEASWGYGERPASLEEFRARFEALIAVLLDNPRMFGYCYTQLTDVEQEQNGLFTANREAKMPVEEMRRIQARPAAYEQD